MKGLVSPGTTPQAVGGARAPAPQVQCDLCEAPMLLPAGATRNGQIIGLLVCTQCTEDALEAAVNTGATLELVGAGCCR